MDQVSPRHTSARIARPRQRSGQQSIAILTTAAVLLAYMPFVGRVDATSAAVSESRVAELIFLAAAILGGVVLRLRSGRSPLPAPARYLTAVVAGFALWAMLTSFNGPLVLTGVFKAGELLAMLFVSLEIVRNAHSLTSPKPIFVTDTVLGGICLTVSVLIVSNIVTVGTPFPLSVLEDWLSTEARERLILGSNHPLESALLLACGMIFAVKASLSWRLKLPIVLAIGWILHLCDARGIETGCVVGLLLIAIGLIPPSPYKLLAGIVVAGAAVIAAVFAVTSLDPDSLLLRLIGGDAFSLNGRTDLWAYILSRVPEHPLLGVGYYSTREYILAAFPFAGHAHNSMLEVLFSTGIVGAAALLAFHGLWVYALFGCADPVVIGLTPIILFESNLDPILFTPGVGMFVMLIALMNAFIDADRHRLARMWSENAERFVPDRPIV